MMVFRKKQTKQAVLTEMVELQTDITPIPTARVPLRIVESKKQRSYEEVAQSLGFIPSELIRAQLLEFFEDQNIKLYNYAEVCVWMTKKRSEANAENWCWRPLREKDSIEDYRWGYSNNGIDDGFYSKNTWSCRPYERLVPLHALEKVVGIETKFGDRVKFFVSDYADPNADPFIMVRPTMSSSGTPAEYNLIFDMWDEPGFGV